MTLNDVSDFSSEGPLRNKTQKPDVTAPGAMIVSALSRDSAPERGFQVDSLHLVEAGTSMATPFVVGVVALLLQRNKQLDPVGVKNLLRAASSIPNQTAGAFSPKWGFGLINALSL